MAVNPVTGIDETPEAKPTFDFTELVDPSNGKILGKYESPQEFQKGYWELVNNSAHLAQENQTYKEILPHLTAERQSPRERSEGRNVHEDNLRTLGLPLDDLDAYVQSRVQQGVKSQFEPLLRTMNARTEVAQTHPQYLQDEAKVMQFVQKTPGLQQEFDNIALTQPAAALRYAYAMYRESIPRDPAQGAGATRASAGIPQHMGGGSSVQSRTPFVHADREKELAAALAYKRESNDPEPYINAWFKGKPLTWTEQLAAQIKEQG